MKQYFLLTLCLVRLAVIVVLLGLLAFLFSAPPVVAEPAVVVTIITNDVESMRAFHEMRGRIFIKGTPERSRAAFTAACEADGHGAFIGEAEPPEPSDPLRREFFCLFIQPPEKRQAEDFCAIAALAKNTPLFLEPNWQRAFTVRCVAPPPKGMGEA